MGLSSNFCGFNNDGIEYFSIDERGLIVKLTLFCESPKYWIEFWSKTSLGSKVPSFTLLSFVFWGDKAFQFLYSTLFFALKIVSRELIFKYIHLLFSKDL